MTARTVTWSILDANSTPARRTVVCHLHAGEGGGDVVAGSIVSEVRTQSDGITGVVSFSLEPNANIEPAGSWYSFTVDHTTPTVVRHYLIPTGTGSVDLDDLTQIELAPPGVQIPKASTDPGKYLRSKDDGSGYELVATVGIPGEVTQGDIDATVTAHVAATDPHGDRAHAQGLVDAEVIARDAAITAAINALVAAAPGALDTLDELAAALGDDANFAATVSTALAGKVPTSRQIAGQALTADVSASTLRAALGLTSVVTASDATASSTTPVDITGATVSYQSGDRLAINAEVWYTGNASGGARIGATFTNATVLLDVEGVGVGAPSFPANRAARGTIETSAGYVEIGCDTASRQRASVRGSLVASGSGTLQLTVAQRSSNGTATVAKAGTTFRAEKST